ncbi:MAG: hypothetical protein JGK21_26885 [Microcoleus sp. PH2017_22_RUC_O_B]|uniref:hypothetical protein n=1 Tax=unclassified Microcoleus TaxID=2642155 RepID=UPI001DE3E361|nr:MULTISPECIES: hypothetical protein [unclassified Microcoleus]MCC3531098.1 hypothetical protein [Microcoleus sp. PH2017_21_RUC_O_A]MCC3543911.1 hypothetical protein [Microcoleus sp. PH2017_22_RUC_O_B]
MNHKISELQTRYSLSSKQSIYDRIKALHIKPVRRGEISSDSLDKLDNLDKFLKNNPGAALSDFPKQTEAITTSKLDLSSGQLDKSTEQLNNFNETLQLVEAIARHLVNRNPLAKYKALDYAVKAELLLPSSKIKELIGVNPCNYGDKFQRGNFIFEKKGKIGRQTAWKIDDI